MRFLVFIVAVAVVFAQHSYLPPASTPGSTNPAVTQANIQQTVCKSGWTKTIRPAAKLTDTLKEKQMGQLGLTGDPHKFEEDHLISLEIGGNPTDPKNLWPQPWPEARLKDVVETDLKRKVCSGAMTLSAAQTAISKDWTVAYQQITGKSVDQALKGKGK